MYDISKTFDGVYHAGLHKYRCYGIPAYVFDLFSPFFGSRWLQVVLDRKCFQEFSINAGVFQSSIPGAKLSFYILMTSLMIFQYYYLC